MFFVLGQENIIIYHDQKLSDKLKKLKPPLIVCREDWRGKKYKILK